MVAGPAGGILVVAHRIESLDPSVAGTAGLAGDTNIAEWRLGGAVSRFEIRDQGACAMDGERALLVSVVQKIFCHLLVKPRVAGDDVVPAERFDERLPAQP